MHYNAFYLCLMISLLHINNKLLTINVAEASVEIYVLSEQSKRAIFILNKINLRDISYVNAFSYSQNSISGNFFYTIHEQLD